MKRIIFSGIIFSFFLISNSQVSKNDVLQDLEKSQSTVQSAVSTATLKSASRLFKDKDDLTSVILVIPSDSIVNVIGSDGIYLKVEFEGDQGYIYANHAEINKTPVLPGQVGSRPPVRDERNGQEARPVQKQGISRYEYLENKYGSSLAARLFERKIWKGMDSQLVKDSWGSPGKINRVINGDEVREEWTYNKTRLYFRNNTLSSWGPVK